jgi:hypothetical protein
VCICTKSGQQPVDGLHSIENTYGCKCRFFIDSKFRRSTNTLVLTNFLNLSMATLIRLAATCCDAATKGDELKNWPR